MCTYFLNRPCVYCSFLLLILFLTSCNWSDRCFFDFGSNWFEPRAIATVGVAPGEAACVTCGGANATGASHSDLHATTAMVVEMLNTTLSTVASSAAAQLAQTKAEWTGIGMEWLRSLLGRREWRIDCLDVYIRL